VFSWLSKDNLDPAKPFSSQFPMVPSITRNLTCGTKIFSTPQSYRHLCRFARLCRFRPRHGSLCLTNGLPGRKKGTKLVKREGREWGGGALRFSSDPTLARGYALVRSATTLWQGTHTTYTDESGRRYCEILDIEFEFRRAETVPNTPKMH
jgi:hypothetical protein